MAAPRIYHPEALRPGQTVTLPAAASRHVQVLRLQPGNALTLFGDPQLGGEWSARITAITRQAVQVCVQAHHAVEREPARAVHLAVAMPANERMDWLVEKATELGVASVQPLMTARSVLRLSGERAAKKVAHWQAVAVAACEQCGGNRVPPVLPVRTLAQALAEGWDAAVVGGATAAPAANAFLSLGADALALRQWAPTPSGDPCRLLIGPEGGLTEAEEQALRAAGWQPLSLGARVLRTETAALAALCLLGLT
ncbi:16S rRNA (uracil(1498)-N(3))-methyltransferase [Tepidimonas charontis]|uniref:Ribosomal RNA small subunit methyltransferase E n=1 Tax=Tepidimonas charontis TaxID=2267262 RepID=A0A554XAE0_9BURK|nr:16S rRNA (uracil(1498)-N(3))-methyltransferase [Tepidimonas charontis]TSE32756.1 Ribosomal RNA small subunit methyltransferase E [Tepidimonas charontis]